MSWIRIIVFVTLACGVSRAGYDGFSVGGTWMIDAYRNTVSPVQAPDACNYWPSCSQFTRAAIRDHGLLIGTIIGADRITRDNGLAWSMVGSYYRDGISHNRIADPVASHVADHPHRDSLGPAIAAAQRPILDVDWQYPSAAFADRLYSSGDYRAAATEYLRVRFTSTDTATRRLAGLMAAESFLAGGTPVQARHAFSDVSEPAIATLADYGVARTWFAQAAYDSVVAKGSRLASTELAPKAAILVGWALLRAHHFTAASAAFARAQVPEASELAALGYRSLPRRNRLVGSLLSAVLPGAGQLYSGRPGDALYSFLAVAGPGLVTCWYAADPGRRDRTHVKTAVFGLVTGVFYAGGVYGANIAARDFNGLQERRYVEQVELLLDRVMMAPDYSSLARH
jgi:putative component of membrane protein insertase Oxa1/YidC/SpoIIIJ protein YidD